MYCLHPHYQLTHPNKISILYLQSLNLQMYGCHLKSHFFSGTFTSLHTNRSILLYVIMRQQGMNIRKRTFSEYGYPNRCS
jgi:hypothetical protein